MEKLRYIFKTVLVWFFDVFDMGCEGRRVDKVYFKYEAEKLREWRCQLPSGRITGRGECVESI